MGDEVGDVVAPRHLACVRGGGVEDDDGGALVELRDDLVGDLADHPVGDGHQHDVGAGERLALLDAVEAGRGLEAGAAGLAFGGDGPVALIGRTDLTALYAEALGIVGREATQMDGERAFILGAQAIAERLS